MSKLSCISLKMLVMCTLYVWNYNIFSIFILLKRISLHISVTTRLIIIHVGSVSALHWNKLLLEKDPHDNEQGRVAKHETPYLVMITLIHVKGGPAKEKKR